MSMDRDLEYTAVRFNTKIDSRVIADLYSHGVVNSIYDLSADGITRIRGSLKEFELQAKTKEAVDLIRTSAL